MTVLDYPTPRSAAGPSSTPQLRSSHVTFIARAGITERLAVILTTFIFLHGLPNTWFVTQADRRLSDGSNPLLVVTELFLIGIALLRIAGSLELVYQALRLEPAITALVALALASTFWSADLYQTAKEGIILASVTLYAVYLILRFALNEILRLLSWMFVISAGLNIAFIAAFPQYAETTIGWDGILPQKNALGFAAVVAIPTLLTAGRENRRYRFVFYLAAVAHLVLLLGSNSKTMLVATVGTVALMIVYRGFRARKTLRGAVIFGLASASAFAAAFATANIALLSEFLDKDVTLTGRTVLWGDLIPIFLERPILGYGYGAAFGGFFSPIHEVWIQNRWDPTHAHNALLQVGLELGIVGMFLTVLILFRGIGRAIKTVRDVPTAVGIWPLAFLSTSLLISISESGVLANSMAWLMYVVALLSTAAQQKPLGGGPPERVEISSQ